MQATVRNSARAGAVVVSSLGVLLLAGCGLDLGNVDSPVAMPGRVIHGNVHGGVYPIQGATIRLMETQTNGYGGAALPLLQTTSDSNGYFTFPDTGWSCDSNQFAYITVTSGKTANNAINNNVAQIGVIGDCSKVLTGKAEIDAVEVYVSELSTIAAAYALRGFITIDNTNAGSGQQLINISAPANNNAASGVCTFTAPTSCVAAGLAHGFQNAYNLVDSVNYKGVLPTGQARLTPPTNGFAYVPQAMINTLANILQSCVDSPGGTVANYGKYVPGDSSSSHCGDLFYWSTPPGSTTPPTNTLQVALNMAQYPTNHASDLYKLQPRAVFFTPTLTQAPNDLSVSVFYLTEAFGAYTGNLTNPVALTLGANDDAFVVATAAAGNANTQTAVLGISTNGSVLFAGPISTKYLYPVAIAADALGNLWLTNNDPVTPANSAILGASPSTGVFSVGPSLPYASGIAVDHSNNVWASVATTAPPTGYGSFNQYSPDSLRKAGVVPLRFSKNVNLSLGNLAIDGNQDVWSVSSSGGGSQAVGWQNRGTPTAPIFNDPRSTSLSANSGSFGVAVDASNQAYFPVTTELDTAFFNAGTNLLSNNQGTYSKAATGGATYNVPNQAEVDGAGNLFWTDYEATGQVFELVPGAGGNVSKGSLTSFLPCYPVNGACYVPAVANARGMQVDSTGALWYVADATFQGYPIGVLIQTFGVGAPTWPQLSLGKPGVMPQ